MKSKKHRSILASFWAVAKPVLTLGISLIVANLSKKTGAFEEVTTVVGNGIGSEVIEQIDDVIERAEDKAHRTIENKREAAPEAVAK